MKIKSIRFIPIMNLKHIKATRLVQLQGEKQGPIVEHHIKGHKKALRFCALIRRPRKAGIIS
jgi:hypothetical protein